ncbi:hypothetical protein PUR61_01885, partial [Streptomyces sp. BE20]|uniref:hypothetical protein n=1 Tax=Streptomyces sp. BE20 TaxID=3002525 RepID=UPI002E7A3BF0
MVYVDSGLVEAEPYLRGAAAAGLRSAANNRGVLMHQLGPGAVAALWWGLEADEAGVGYAANALGAL